MSPVPFLIGSSVLLKPLAMADAEALAAASADGDLSSLQWTIVPNRQTVREYIQLALDHQAQGLAIPFVIALKSTGQIIGSTRLFKIDRANRMAEIGHSWIARSWQRSSVNTECKYLLFRYAFEGMGCMRVQLCTDENNATSRAAIARLGAVQEGILRKERVMPDGRIRTTVMFSVIDDEWPAVREGLESKLRRGGVEPHYEVLSS